MKTSPARAAVADRSRSMLDRTDYAKAVRGSRQLGEKRQDQEDAYRQSVEEALRAFGADARNGLSKAEARARLEKNGKNELTAEKPVPAWRKFLAQFQDVLVILLLIATAISTVFWFFERESALPYEAIAIFAVVLLNAIMGYLQESRAETAVAALRQMSAAHANVIRDGERQSIPASELVPGDIVLIEEGDTIPADARDDSVHRAANRRGRADRREHAGVQRHAPDCRRGRTRRPPQHDLQRHSGNLRPRSSRGGGDRNANRNGAHCRNAEGSYRRNALRCRKSSTASASCSASSSSSSPS